MIVVKNIFCMHVMHTTHIVEIDENTVIFYVCGWCRYIRDSSTHRFDTSNTHRIDSQTVRIYSVCYLSHKCIFRPAFCVVLRPRGAGVSECHRCERMLVRMDSDILNSCFLHKMVRTNAHSLHTTRHRWKTQWKHCVYVFVRTVWLVRLCLCVGVPRTFAPN
jgi:hypothetical protein